MEKNRVEAFSDGVIAIIITIMVLELKPPAGAGWADLRDSLPQLYSYVLSFIYVAIYWNNHHHMLHTVRHVNGAILWANMHLLFWLSLVPLTTEYLRHYPGSEAPTAIYGGSLLMPALAYFILQNAIISSQGENSLLRRAVGKDIKGKMSALLYLAGIALAFIDSLISDILYIGVALIWLVPDKRIERVIGPES